VSGAEILSGGRPGAYALRMDGMDQSYVDLDDPTRLAYDYVRRIADLLDAAAPAGQPLRVVHVGGAALTLPRYVAATRPRSSQVVLEPDAAQTELVRRELPLPPRSGIRVRPVAGREGVAALRDASADVVVVDAFEGGRLPASLAVGGFWADVRRVVGPAGLAVVNLVDRAPFAHSRRVLAGLRGAFATLAAVAEPATWRGRRAGNLVVAATDGDGGAWAGSGVAEAWQAAVARAVAPHKVLDDRGVRDSLGGAAPFTDADAEPGPPP